MARKLAGSVAMHGVDGTVVMGSLTAIQNKVQSHQVADQANISVLQQGDGDIVGKAASGRKRRLTLEVIVIADAGTNTLANAKTNSATLANSASLSTVVLAGTGVYDGDYNLESINFNGRIGEYNSFTLEVEQVQQGASFVGLTPI